MDADAVAPRYNPLGKIPVLIVDDGECCYESRFILEYMALRYPEQPWRHHAHLETLAQRLWERPSFRDTVPVRQSVVGVV